MSLNPDLPVLNFTSRPCTTQMNELGIVDILPHFRVQVQAAFDFPSSSTPPTAEELQTRCDLFANLVEIVCNEMGYSEGYALINPPAFMAARLEAAIDQRSPCEPVYAWVSISKYEMPCGDGSTTVVCGPMIGGFIHSL